MTLILLVGPAGVGKTTIWEEIIRQFNFKPLNTYTTRKQREEDMKGLVQYNFISKEEFEAKIEENFFFEFEPYTKGLYGTSNADLKNAELSEEVFVAVVDIRGALKIKKSFNAISIFILPPTIEEMERRILGRNSETTEEVSERLRIAVEEEIPKKDLLDFSITNDTIENAIRQISEIIQKVTV